MCPLFPQDLPPYFSYLCSSTSNTTNTTIHKKFMASKLVSLSKLNKILIPTVPRLQTITRSAYSSASSSSSNHEPQDDDAMTQGVDTQGETCDPKQDNKDNITPTKEDDHYIRPKTPPSNLSSSKLQTPGVNTPIDPHLQQRRALATKPNNDLTCAGLDVSVVNTPIHPHVKQRRMLATKPSNDLTCAGLDRSRGVKTTSDLHVQQRRTLATKPNNGLTCAGLDLSGVNTPIDPHVQQRRTLATEQKNDLTCAGLDGSPWREEENVSREEQEEDDKDYFKDHKASPLSNMEMGDTRKPLEKVVQATAGGYFGGEKVMGWLPEQLDTAEESLLRAMRMFREAAARGVPEWPHSRRLRELRGEDW